MQDFDSWDISSTLVGATKILKSLNNMNRRKCGADLDDSFKQQPSVVQWWVLETDENTALLKRVSRVRFSPEGQRFFGSIARRSSKWLLTIRRGSDSLYSRNCSCSWVRLKLLPLKQKIAGSNPSGSTYFILGRWPEMASGLTVNQLIKFTGSSSLSRPTKFEIIFKCIYI